MLFSCFKQKLALFVIVILYFFYSKFQDLLEKEGYPTPGVFQKACEHRHYDILAYLIKFCIEKQDKIEGKSKPYPLL